MVLLVVSRLFAVLRVALLVFIAPLILCATLLIALVQLVLVGAHLDPLGTLPRKTRCNRGLRS